VNAANFYAPDIAATKTSTPAPTEITFVSIPGGTFQMGNIENDINGDTGEKPLHTVTVSSFQMSDAEITNVIYCNWLNNALKSGDITATGMIVTGAKGAYSGQAYLHLSETYNADNKCWISYNNNTFSVMPGKETWPVVYVTWYGAKAFAEWYGLDLAREAEWEYACRGGRQYKYGTDDGTISKDKANYLNNGPNHPVDVKSYPKNPFGLYDMSGNVWEFCNDWWEAYASGYQTNPLGPQAGLCRVIRGGCFDFTDIGCRSAYRNGINPFLRGYNLGFRVVRRPGGLVY